MMGEAEVADGVVVADVADHVADKAIVVGKLSVFDILSDDVAEESAEILVTREGEEGAGVGQHADKVRQKSDGGECIDLALHSLKGVIEPPAGAELDLATVRGFLKRAAGGREDGVVPGVEVVDDGLGKLVDFAERIEEGEKSLTLRPITDGIKSGIRSELVKETGVGITLWSEVELHGPVFFGDPLADVIHDESAEGIGLFGIGRFAFARVCEDAVGLTSVAGIGEGVAHSVIGHAASFFVEEIEAGS